MWTVALRRYGHRLNLVCICCVGTGIHMDKVFQKIKVPYDSLAAKLAIAEHCRGLQSSLQVCLATQILLVALGPHLMHRVDLIVGECPRAAVAPGNHVIHKLAQILSLCLHYSLKPYLDRAANNSHQVSFSTGCAWTPF